MPLITYYSPRSSDLPTALLSGRLYCVLKPRYKSIWHTYRIRDLTSWYSCGLRFKIVLCTYIQILSKLYYDQKLIESSNVWDGHRIRINPHSTLFWCYKLMAKKGKFWLNFFNFSNNSHMGGRNLVDKGWIFVDKMGEFLWAPFTNSRRSSKSNNEKKSFWNF